MDPIRVTLFGQFQIECCGETMIDAFSPRLQELLCYLLLFRGHAHPREVLASQLWPESTTYQSRRNLRQILWQLQGPADLGGVLRECGVLLVDRESIRLNPEAKLWLDAKVFEDTLSRTEGLPGRALDTLQADALRAAVALYQGDLLEGWYQDWCLYERERLQNAYLQTLEKLMDYCATIGEYDRGLAYGRRALQRDGARERTHRRVMRLNWLVGERSAALRQYARCVEALRRELGVQPAARTVALYQQIRVGQLAEMPRPIAVRVQATNALPASWTTVVARLQEMQDELAELQGQMQDTLDIAQRMAIPRE